MSNIAEDATGKWHGIFNALGIEVGDGRHCKCPSCGGVDRFRMDNRDNRGTYFCNHCGAGDGFMLVQNVLGCDFKQAAIEIEKIIGTVTTVSNIPKEKKIDAEYLRGIFVGSKPASPGCLVWTYLENRGLTNIPNMLRAHPTCKEPETNSMMPAMLAVFTAQDGEALTMHRTFLDGLGGKAQIEKEKKILPGLKPLAGGAIRLFDQVNETIGIAEGIETAIAVNEMFNIPCWSVVSTALMVSFVPPKGIKNVIVFADNDKNFAGQAAAYCIANKLAIKGFNVSVFVPEIVGDDFLDQLTRNPAT